MNPQMSLPEWQGILGDPGLGELSFQDSVIDSPPVTTRAGLYIYLNALLHDRPTFDDLATTIFLNSRYNEDVPSLVGDLILASFDVLANAAARHESQRALTTIRSFITNKLPVFLQNNYASLIFEPLSIEHCIRQALGRIDPSAFPSFNQMFDFGGPNSVLSEARQEFLFACALHQLIPEQSIEDILGDVPMQSLPAGGRYVKNELVSQWTANPAKIEHFISELENMEGNAGEIAGALIEIMHSLLNSNDTMTLKSICNLFSRKPAVLDVMMLFTSQQTLLQPFCHTLDNWQNHEDQGEYQPVYDEFGSILLFVSVVRHRLKLLPEELGIDTPDSFTLQFFRSSSSSRPLDELSEHENELLGSWINGLFGTEGISDEIMSACKPSEFHLLATTMFDQSLKACQAGIITMDTLKGGFEYLLEPFLLPSLVASLTWFADHLWETNPQSTNTDTILPVLQAILKPPSMSHDSSMIHSAVLSVVSKRLETSLNHIKKTDPSRTDINPLLTVLAPYTNDKTEEQALRQLSTWSTTPEGGLLTALRTSIRTLITWSASSADTAPPSYTHQQISNSVQLTGAKAVLGLLLDEAIAQSVSVAYADIAFDIIAVLIHATQSPFSSPPPSQPLDSTTPSPPPNRKPRVRLTLSSMLLIESQDAAELSQKDPARANLIVRLQRRVDAFGGLKPAAAMGVVGVGDGGGVGGAFMTTDVVRNAEGMPTTDIDDVLMQAKQETAEGHDFLAHPGGVGDGGVVLGMA